MYPCNTYVMPTVFILLVQINGLMHAYEDCLYLTIERKRSLSSTTTTTTTTTTTNKTTGSRTPKPIPLPRKNRPVQQTTTSSSTGGGGGGGGGGGRNQPLPPICPPRPPPVTPRRGVTSPNRPTHSLSSQCSSDNPALLVSSHYNSTMTNEYSSTHLCMHQSTHSPLCTHCSMISPL